MAEYIEREKVMQAIGTVRNIYSEAKNFVAVSAVDNVIGEIVDEVPAADAAPVVHGRWDDSFDGITPVCSVCGRTHKCFNRTPNYCPNCGAKMDGNKVE